MKLQRIHCTLTIAAILAGGVATAQAPHDTGRMKQKKNAFYEQIQKANKTFWEKPEPGNLQFKMNLDGADIPTSRDGFTMAYAFDPVSQGEAGTCWCFSTTSFYEAEIHRLTGKNIRLSELYTVYWEYVEKAREFVRTRGTSAFAEGSETNAVKRMMKEYGIVPWEAYSGLKPGQPYHDHKKLIAEMTGYLESVKASNAWNTDEVLATIRSILNHYIGEPPATVTVKGKQLTPKEYLKQIAEINPDDYVDFMSLMEVPYWTRAEYAVPDNWWHAADYYNVPLDVFAGAVKAAIAKGYSLSIGGDVSESGIDSESGVMMVPTYDIPSDYIDENARQFRFSNHSTTDDHAMHLVGFANRKNGTWYLVKDSGSGGHNNRTAPGYYYMHEDFLKLKMMSFTVHRDAVKDILVKFPEKMSLK